jgi:hypothetical protein
MPTRPWSDIRATMNPDARARVDAKVQHELYWIDGHGPLPFGEAQHRLDEQPRYGVFEHVPLPEKPYRRVLVAEPGLWFWLTLLAAGVLAFATVWYGLMP